MSKTYIGEFHRQLQEVINKCSKENGSNTPDFILADYLAACLINFDEAIKLREKWYGKQPENKTTDSFQWTDELVKELIYRKLGIPSEYYGNAQKMLDEFKHSYAIPKPQAESKSDRYWEILEMINKYGKRHVGILEVGNDWTHYLNKSMWQINKVKRLSDGEVFSVGDEVSTYDKGGDGFSDRIHHFTYTSGVDIIDVYFENFAGGFKINDWLKNAQKVKFKTPPKPQKEEPVNMLKEFNTYAMRREMEERGVKPEEQRIEVMVEPHSSYKDPRIKSNELLVTHSGGVAAWQYPLIKQAIEQVLNDDGKSIMEKFQSAWLKFTIKYPEIKDKQIRDAIEVLVNSGYVVEKTDVQKHSVEWFHPYFTQQQVDAMCEKAFYAGRMIKDGTNGYGKLYPRFDDYQKSKQ